MDEYVLKFFKESGFYNKEYFNKLSKNTIIIDKNYEDIVDFVGFYPDNFKIVLPKIKTISDVLIWIHEYSHALFPEDSSEIFPNLMEAKFINMYIDDKEIINELINKFQSIIDNSSCMEHVIANKIKINAIK